MNDRIKINYALLLDFYRVNQYFTNILKKITNLTLLLLTINYAILSNVYKII